MTVVSIPASVTLPVRRTRGHARRAAIALLWLAIVGIIATDVFILVEHNQTTPVTLGDALHSFRASAGAADSAPAASLREFAPAPAAATPVPSAPAVPSTPTAVSGPAPKGGRTSVAAPVATPGGTTSTEAAAPFTRPAPGVYSYRTTGGESISVASSSHQYPSETYATVQLLDGCNWEIRNEVIKEHMDRRVMCSRTAELAQMLQEREVEFFGQRDGMVLHCTPPDVMAKTGDTPGTVHESTCSDGQTSAKLRGIFTGIEDMNVGSQPTKAIHVSVDGNFTGKATGSSHDELWFAPDTGMTLRWDRTVDTVADASFGAKVRYQEKASFVLESLVPQR